MRRLAFLAAAVLLSACQSAEGAAPAELAVYAEYSASSKPMAPGWNTRVFDRREIQQGIAIALDDKTGIVTLAPGFYHIVASSLVSYYDPKHPATVPVEAAPPGGYSRLRYASDPSSISDDKAIALSTIGTADAVPTLIDTYFRVDKKSRILLEHQVGRNVKNIYLHVYTENSPWHVFARISIQRIP